MSKPATPKRTPTPTKTAADNRGPTPEASVRKSSPSAPSTTSPTPAAAPPAASPKQAVTKKSPTPLGGPKLPPVGRGASPPGKNGPPKVPSIPPPGGGPAAEEKAAPKAAAKKSSPTPAERSLEAAQAPEETSSPKAPSPKGPSKLPAKKMPSPARATTPSKTPSKTPTATAASHEDNDADEPTEASPPKPSGAKKKAPAPTAAKVAPPPAAADAEGPHKDPVLSVDDIRRAALTQMLTSAYTMYDKAKLPSVETVVKSHMAAPKMLYEKLEATYNMKKGFPASEVTRIIGDLTEKNDALKSAEESRLKKIHASLDLELAVSTAADAKNKVVMLEALQLFYKKYAPEKVDSAEALLKKYEGFEEDMFDAAEERYNCPGEIKKLIKERSAAFTASVPDAKTKRAMVEALQLFYQKYAPEKVNGVETLLKKYEGFEEDMFDAAEERYNCPGEIKKLIKECYNSGDTAPAASAAPLDSRKKRVMVEALKLFYEKYAPEKVDSAEALLKKYEGFEEDMFDAAEERYNCPGEMKKLMRERSAALAAPPPEASNTQSVSTTAHLLAPSTGVDVWEEVKTASASAPRKMAPILTFQEQLEYLCDKFCPEQTSSISNALKVYQGREVELVARLHTKYSIKHTGEYLPTVDAREESRAQSLMADPQLKQAADFARFYGLGPQVVPRLAMEHGSDKPDDIMFDLLCMVFPDAVSSAFEDEAQCIALTSRRMSEFLSYHNPKGVALISKVLTHFEAKGIKHAMGDLLIRHYGDMLQRVKMKSFTFNDLYPEITGSPHKLHNAVRYAEYRRACDRWAQHFGTASRTSRSTPRDLGKLGDMFDACTSTSDLPKTPLAERGTCTNHREEEAMLLLSKREAGVITDIKQSDGVSYRSERERELRGLGGYQPSLAEARRERHVDMFGMVPSEHPINRDPTSGQIYITNPTIFLDDPQCSRCKVVESQLAGAMQKLQQVRSELLVRERLRMFDELQQDATPPTRNTGELHSQHSSVTPLPFYGASSPVRAYGTQSSPQSQHRGGPPAAASSQSHRPTFDEGCAGCKDLRKQLNHLSQTLHNVRSSRGNASSSLIIEDSAASATGNRSGVGQRGEPATTSLWEVRSGVATTAPMRMGYMRDASTMSNLTSSHIADIENYNVLDQL